MLAGELCVCVIYRFPILARFLLALFVCSRSCVVGPQSWVGSPSWSVPFGVSYCCLRCYTCPPIASLCNACSLPLHFPSRLFLPMPCCIPLTAAWLAAVTKRCSGWACIGNPKPEQETIEGTHAQETPAYQRRPTTLHITCLLYTSPSPRDRQKSRMPSSA